MRYIGRFLPDDPLDVPWVVIQHLGRVQKGHSHSLIAAMWMVAW
ncbi:hypothetical protein [Actinomadura sp. 9N215]